MLQVVVRTRSEFGEEWQDDAMKGQFPYRQKAEGPDGFCRESPVKNADVGMAFTLQEAS